MEFGISLPTDPPIGAQVEKAKLAEACEGPEPVIETYGRDIIPTMTTVAH